MAALLLSMAVGTASARNLSISNPNIRVTWSNLEFVGTVTVRCQLTLEGSFHRNTIVKERGTLIGAITRATVKTESCTNARLRTEGLPWHLTYEGFRGTLPNITEVFLLISRFLIRFERLLGSSCECRYGTATDNVTYTAVVEAGGISNLIPVEGRATLTLLEARGETALIRCPLIEQKRAATNDGVVRLLTSATTRIRITLI
ncbi:MAG TPA: hypothetical protein VFS59_07330 [Gemmatimonadaceae bacterium]|nr:hypothetical protein [Gemmatimonadaceae bacterium]